MFKKFTCLIYLLLFTTPVLGQYTAADSAISIHHEIPLYSSYQKDSLEIRTPLMKKNHWMTRYQNPDSFRITAGVNDSTLAYRMWPSTALEVKLYGVDTLDIITMGGIVDGTTLTNYIVPLCTTHIKHCSTAATAHTDTAVYVIKVDGATRVDSTNGSTGYRYLRSTSNATKALPVWDVFWIFKNPNASAIAVTDIKEGWVIRKRK